MPEVLTETDRTTDFKIAALLEPAPPLAHCRSMHDTVSPLGAWVHTHIYEHGDECEVVPRCFSSDIALAMRVVERMRNAGVWTFIKTYTQTTQVFVEMGVPSSECQEWGATMAEAICKCALKAEAKFQAIAKKLAVIESQQGE